MAESDGFGAQHRSAGQINRASPNQIDSSVNYADDKLRKQSFNDCWPGEQFKPNIERMVTAGFVYIGPGDFVECYKCGMKLHQWGRDEDPMSAHIDYQKKKRILCELYPGVTAGDFYERDSTQEGADQA